MPQKPRVGKDSVSDPSWRGLYLAASLCALLFAVLVAAALVVLAAAPPVPARGGAAVLGYIVAHKAAYLAQLICFVGLAAPALVVFLALALALGHAGRGLAAAGALVGISSEIIALALGSSPQSLHPGLVLLADQYAAAGALERVTLASAADALIAATNAVSWAGILTAVGILLLSLLMRKTLFHKAVAYIGIVTGALGVVSETLRLEIGPAYLLYGLLLPAWFVMVGVKLFSLRK